MTRMTMREARKLETQEIRDRHARVVREILAAAGLAGDDGGAWLCETTSGAYGPAERIPATAWRLDHRARTVAAAARWLLRDGAAMRQVCGQAAWNHHARVRHA